MSTKLRVSAIALLIALASGIPNAFALLDTTSYTIDTGNPGLACCTGPYATVQIDLTTSTTATITFTSLTNGGYIYLLGDGGTADLNVNGAYTLGTVTESNSISGFAPSFKDNTPGQVDGFGSFTLSLNNNGGFQETATTVQFDLTLNSGTWTSAADVLTPNSQGAIAAVHSFACAQPGCSTTSGALTTGFAATSGGPVPPVNVPEPSALILFGSGLVALSILAKHRLRARSMNT